MADAIAAATRQMSTMIRDLVESVRLDSGQVELARQRASGCSPSSRTCSSAGAMDVDRIRVEIPADLPDVEADPGRIERVFVNLVGNALKYPRPGTEVWIRTTATPTEIAVSIADHGDGIAPEDLPRIFDRYNRGRSVSHSEGLGLGLIVRRLVEAHGIWPQAIFDRSRITSGT